MNNRKNLKSEGSIFTKACIIQYKIKDKKLSIKSIASKSMRYIPLYKSSSKDFLLENNENNIINVTLF